MKRISLCISILVMSSLFIGNLLRAGDLPQNSHPSILGTGWECDWGYYKSGKGCIKVNVPANATINTLGNGWTCNSGYKQVKNTCLPMTNKEIQEQQALLNATLRKNTSSTVEKGQRRRL